MNWNGLTISMAKTTNNVICDRQHVRMVQIMGHRLKKSNNILACKTKILKKTDRVTRVDNKE